MGFGDFYFQLREGCGNFRSQHSYHGIFCVEVTGVDEVQTQLLGVPELVVLNVGSNKGVAAGIQGFQYSTGAAAAADGYFAHRLAPIHIAKALAAQSLLHMRQKCREGDFCREAAAEQAPFATLGIYAGGVNYGDLFQPQSCGQGVIDMKPIYEACVETGIANVFVEQDNAPDSGDSLGQMKISYENLKSLF